MCSTQWVVPCPGVLKTPAPSSRRAPPVSPTPWPSRSVAPGDPLIEVGCFGADGGVGPVTGVHRGGTGKAEQSGPDRLDDGREARERPTRRTRPTVEQRVTGEQRAGLLVIETDPARRVA